MCKYKENSFFSTNLDFDTKGAKKKNLFDVTYLFCIQDACKMLKCVFRYMP